MGFNLTQIINKVLPVQTYGSNDYYSDLFTATTTEQLVKFPITAQEVVISNDGKDGTSDLLVALNNYHISNAASNTVYDQNDPTWTYTGTWNSTALHYYGTDSKFTTVAGTAIFAPQISAYSIGWALVGGTGTGIVTIDISTDGGTTWVQPSTVAGLTRSDGATGTALNTYDCYVAGSSASYITLTYTVQTAGNLAIRITSNATKNASSAGTQVFVDAGIITTSFAGKTVTLHPGESLSLQVKSSQLYYAAVSGTQNFRLIARG